jgi:hypothetical protein
MLACIHQSPNPMKYHLIALSLSILSLTACNLENVKDSQVQKLAAEKNVPELVSRYINQPPSFGTDQAAEALGDLGDPKAVEPLAKLLSTPLPSGAGSPEIKARSAAAIALGKLKDARAIKPLAANVKHKSPYWFRWERYASDVDPSPQGARESNDGVSVFELW